MIFHSGDAPIRPIRPPFLIRVRRPHPRTFAMTQDDLERLDKLAKPYRHRSKVLRMVIRQFNDDTIRTILPYVHDQNPTHSARIVTVSMAVQPDDLQKLNQWTTRHKFPSRSALVRAMIRWASDD